MSAGAASAPDLAGTTNPVVYEIDTWPWLQEVSALEGVPVDLGSVPDRYWDELAAAGYDAVWLMGVWQRSPAGIALALSNDELVASFRDALPDWTVADVVGSPYCVRGYVVDDRLGGRQSLASARTSLADRGMGLILDFVPNHVAPDHPWATTRPELFVTGDAGQLERDPSSFVQVGSQILANGRDPYFPAWPDVVQLNAFEPALREAVIATLGDIADQCDGVRCDMAMLMMNDIFARTWADFVGPAPDTDYWPTVIEAVRRAHPRFQFIAEAYWDLESALQQQGFDYCYDKRLYDRLHAGPAEDVAGHLHADARYQQGLVRFVENHDEPRARAAFGTQRSQVVAVAALTQTGMRLIHHGQPTGALVHLPVFLDRYAAERADPTAVAFYQTLLPVLADPALHDGRWQLCEQSGWPGDDRYRSIVSWCWTGASRWLIVVNLSDRTVAGLIHTPWEDLRRQQWRLVDPTQQTSFDRSGDDLVDGLFVQLPSWGWHVLRIDPLPEPNVAGPELREA